MGGRETESRLQVGLCDRHKFFVVIFTVFTFLGQQTGLAKKTLNVLDTHNTLDYQVLTRDRSSLIEAAHVYLSSEWDSERFGTENS